MGVTHDAAERRRYVFEQVARGKPVAQVCREAGISRTLFYRWKRLYQRYGAAGLASRSARRRRLGRQSAPALERAVVACALREPARGPGYIAARLGEKRHGGWRVSATGVYKILRRHGLRTRWERFARQEGVQPAGDRPGELVCLGSIRVMNLTPADSLWQLTACDAAVGYGIGQLVRDRPGPKDASRFLAERVIPAYARAGHGISLVLTGRGAEWRDSFEDNCRAADIEHRRRSARSRWAAGFLERLEGLVLRELWRQMPRRPALTSVDDLERQLQGWLRSYNEERPHSRGALRGKTPAALFRRRVP